MAWVIGLPEFLILAFFCMMFLMVCGGGRWGGQKAIAAPGDIMVW